jgi:polysaccharide biosynthesis/export protein
MKVKLFHVILAVAAVTAGCAGNRSPAAELPAARPNAAEALTRPGDQISLRIWREPEMSDTFGIAADGYVILPTLGSVRATDLGVVALQDTLRGLYAEYLRNPSVEVTVLRRIAVSGEVRRPDLYLVDLTVSLREIIAKAGGITEAGNMNDVVILRADQRFRLNAGRDSPLRAAELESGDQIFVGRRSWIERNPLAFVSTLSGALSLVVGILYLARS